MRNPQSRQKYTWKNVSYIFWRPPLLKRWGGYNPNLKLQKWSNSLTARVKAFCQHDVLCWADQVLPDRIGPGAQESANKNSLGGGNSNIFYFHSYLVKMNPFWLIFFRWVVQPPTSSTCLEIGFFSKSLKYIYENQDIGVVGGYVFSTRGSLWNLLPWGHTTRHHKFVDEELALFGWVVHFHDPCVPRYTRNCS